MKVEENSKDPLVLENSIHRLNGAVVLSGCELPSPCEKTVVADIGRSLVTHGRLVYTSIRFSSFFGASSIVQSVTFRFSPTFRYLMKRNREFDKVNKQTKKLYEVRDSG